MANLTNINNKFLVTTGGDVGIGTTSPAEKLEVAGSIKSTSRAIAGGSTAGITLSYDTSNSIGLIETWTSKPIGIETAGVRRMTIDSSGNVGIGVSPSHRLSVWDTGGGTVASFSNGVNADLEINLTSGVTTLTPTTGILAFGTSSTERMRITSGGNVGIGTSTLNTISGTNPTLTLGGTGISGGLILQRAGTDKARLYENAGNMVHQGMTGVGHHFYVNAATQAMVIDSSGDVGIGTDSPSEKLHVVDTSNPAATSGSVIIEGRRDGGANVLTLRAKDASAPTSALPNGQGAVLRWQGFDGTDFENMGYIYVAADGQAVGDGDAPSYMSFGTSADGSSSPTERMRIDSSGKSTFAGNVGIGVTPTGRALQVHGATSVFCTMLVSDSASGTTGTGGGIGFQSDQGQGVSVLLAAIQGIKENSTAGDQSGALIFATKSPSPHTTAERMRIDSSGNVGINSTASLRFNGTGDNTHAVGYDSVIDGSFLRGQLGMRFLTGTGGGTERMRINSNGYIEQGIVGTTGNAYYYFNTSTSGDSGLIFRDNTSTNSGYVTYNHFENAMKFGVNGSERMRIDSSGVVKISNTGAAHLILNGDTNNSGDTGEVDGIIDFLGDGNPGIYGYRINTENWSGQTALHFQEYINGSYTSRLKIDKDGNVGIGLTSPSDKLQVTTSADQYTGRFDYTGSSGAVSAYGCLKLRISANTSPSFIDFFYDGFSTNPLSPVGAIVTTGTATSYASFSDYRMKQNVNDLTNVLDKVVNLKPKTFNYKNVPDVEVQGFLAHELQEVIPQAVHGEKDEIHPDGNPKYQLVDHSHMIPLLTAAIKELKADNDSLKARIETLENN